VARSVEKLEVVSVVSVVSPGSVPGSGHLVGRWGVQGGGLWRLGGGRLVGAEGVWRSMRVSVTFSILGCHKENHFPLDIPRLSTDSPQRPDPVRLPQQFASPVHMIHTTILSPVR
jgi:hypothetical protein